MLRHVVMFTWAEGATEGQKQAVRDGLNALPDQIPEIRSYKIGDDAGLAAGNYDFVVVGDFEDADAFVTYRDHPAHQKVIAECIRPILAQRAAVQHEWHYALPEDLPG